ncbi:hypothetical protein TSAR_002616 [Trichomalopsis sarcophagae]|uniref:Cytochrome P450 n=1 Tax=Trichomalopsis sarcophagae TaxID=543379 RepID=A0A232EII0_9HYME|nr:hypothetical protein TSAR_002616 [Trichomalopsis sarcophagae]
MAVLYLLLVFIVIGLIAFHVRVRYGRVGSVVAKIPGPYPLPFLGNLLSFAGNREELWNKLRALMKGCSIKRIWFPTRAWILIQDAEDMELLLTSKVNLNKGQAYDLSLKWLHTGLLTSKREKWTERRKIVNTGFHYNVMKKYVEISTEYTKQFVEQIKSHGDECVLNILPLLSDLTLQIICESALGISLAKLDNKVLQEYKEAIREIDDIFVYRGARPYITDWMLYFLPLGRRQDHAIKILHDFTDRIIRERKEYHANFKENRSYQHFADDVEESAEDDSFKGTKKRLVMLDVLLSAEQDGLIDEKGIREEVDVLVLAVEKYLLPAGVDVAFFVYDLHRDPKHWQEPEKFDPDRFLEENVKKRHPFAYMPFSAGPRNCIEQLWTALRQITKEYPITRLWFLTRVWVLVRDPDDIEVLLTSKVNVNKRAVYECALQWLETGLLTSDREKWTKRRKIVNTGFHFNIMKKYVDITCEQSEKFVEEIIARGDESVLNIAPLFSDLALQIICESALGVSLAKLDSKLVQQYKQALHVMFDMAVYRGTRPYITDWMMNFLPIGRKQNRAIKVLHDFTNKGHDTTAVTMVFILMLIAENPVIQARARAEVTKIFSESGGKLEIPVIQKFDYLDRCLKEAMRLYPTISQIMRYIDEDVQLKKYVVPAGVDVLFLIYDLHRDPKHWPEPEKFDPDRFLPENIKNRHPFAYIPFSAGPRNCIGHLTSS